MTDHWRRTHPAHTDTARTARAARTARGADTAVLRRLESGVVALGETQFLPGSSVLLVGDPEVTHLSDLPRRRRLSFLSDLDRLGEAVERTCRRMDGSFRQVDLDIPGDGGGPLRAHVWPRFAWEPPELLDRPVWLYPPESWCDGRFRLGPQHRPLREAIGSELDRSRPRPPESAGPSAGDGPADPYLGGVESLLVEVFTAAGRACGSRGRPDRPEPGRGLPPPPSLRPLFPVRSRRDTSGNQ
ncbi:hypothetical protein GCM10027091_64210 [Streptomyces daliensis]